MPHFEFEELTDDDEPLFTDEDPLTITVPAVVAADGKTHVFTCTGKQPMPDEDRFDANMKPVKYGIELIALGVVEHQQEACRDALHEAYDIGTVDLDHLGKLIKFLSDERSKAKKRQAKRKTGRPTTAQSPSSP